VIADFVELLIFLPILKSIEHFHRWLFVKIQNDHNSLQKKERKEIVLLSGGRGERDGDSSAPKCADYGNKWTDKKKKRKRETRGNPVNSSDDPSHFQWLVLLQPLSIPSNY
jgi:hypothetical protein